MNLDALREYHWVAWHETTCAYMEKDGTLVPYEWVVLWKTKPSLLSVGYYQADETPSIVSVSILKAIWEINIRPDELRELPELNIGGG